MKESIGIVSVGSISALGTQPDEIWQNYQDDQHYFSESPNSDFKVLAGFLPDKLQAEIENLRTEDSRYRNLDRSVLLAILASRKAFNGAGLDRSSGINVGSSRGATELFEKYHKEYIETGSVSTYTSPTTTLGNISSWVAQDLQLSGPEFSHSITCSTGMHSILNGIAWMKSGITDSFFAGGSEAPLTGFTLAQMKAMKIYSRELTNPCRSLDMDKTGNTMILGEGAGMVALQKNSDNPKAYIKGIGYATEKLKHGASLSKNGDCLQKSMKMAMSNSDISQVDAIVMHAPGTIGGDLAEVNAVKNIFGKEVPAMTSNKWKIGHSFGASGILSLEMAILMLQHQKFLPVPFSEFQRQPDKLENIMVNSVGFGGNAVSLLIGREK